MGRYSKDKRDLYYRAAKLYSYRARSAFKLLQLDKQFQLFNENTNNILDLCAAPGSWTQIAQQQLQAINKSNYSIVAVDLAAILPIPNVTIIQADLTHYETVDKIKSHLNNCNSSDRNENSVSLVLCDGAPDVIGIHDIDEIIQHNLTISALTLTIQLLELDGTFLCKIFRGKQIDQIYRLFYLFFDELILAKPKTCRNSSIEGFLVCRKFNPIWPNYKQLFTQHNPISFAALQDLSSEQLERSNRIVPFAACNEPDYCCWDADQSYELKYQISLPQHIQANNSGEQSERGGYNHLLPLAAPIDPPYKKSLQMKKQNQFKSAVNVIERSNNSNNNNSLQ
jgi:tRNA (cytidine32/guanosine34-2'-O)-methyltransferase